MSVDIEVSNRRRLVNELAPSMREVIFAIGRTVSLSGDGERLPGDRARLPHPQLRDPLAALESSVETFLDAIEQQLDPIERFRRLNGLLDQTRTLLRQAEQLFSSLDVPSKQTLRHLRHCLHTYLHEVGEED